MNSKKAALELIDQLVELEKIRDAEYVKLLAEKKVYRNGESVIVFHLKALKELIDNIDEPKSIIAEIAEYRKNEIMRGETPTTITLTIEQKQRLSDWVDKQNFNRLTHNDLDEIFGMKIQNQATESIPEVHQMPIMRSFVYCKSCNLVTHYTMYSLFVCYKCKGETIDVPNGVLDCKYAGGSRITKVKFLNGEFVKDSSN